MTTPANASPKPEHRYELIVYWSDADSAFVVEVPELPGCMADGSTYTEAVAAAKQKGEDDPGILKTPDDWSPKVFRPCA